MPLQDYHLLRSTFQVVHDTMSLSAFARRYLRNHGCFLFLWLLRCFTSPGSLPYPMHSGMNDHKWPGFPIQKSTDQSLFASSPWLIAGYNVFRRLSMPRHPPYALNSFINPTSNRHQTITSFPSGSRVGSIYPTTRRGPAPHTRGDMFCQGVTGKHLKRLHSVLLNNSATPKNLSNCQRALSHAEAFDFSRCCGPGFMVPFKGRYMRPGSKQGRGV